MLQSEMHQTTAKLETAWKKATTKMKRRLERIGVHCSLKVHVHDYGSTKIRSNREDKVCGGLYMDPKTWIHPIDDQFE